MNYSHSPHQIYTHHVKMSTLPSHTPSTAYHPMHVLAPRALFPTMQSSLINTIPTPTKASALGNGWYESQSAHKLSKYRSVHSYIPYSVANLPHATEAENFNTNISNNAAMPSSSYGNLLIHPNISSPRFLPSGCSQTSVAHTTSTNSNTTTAAQRVQDVSHIYPPQHNTQHPQTHQHQQQQKQQQQQQRAQQQQQQHYQHYQQQHQQQQRYQQQQPSQQQHYQQQHSLYPPTQHAPSTTLNIVCAPTNNYNNNNHSNTSPSISASSPTGGLLSLTADVKADTNIPPHNIIVLETESHSSHAAAPRCSVEGCCNMKLRGLTQKMWKRIKKCSRHLQCKFDESVRTICFDHYLAVYKFPKGVQCAGVKCERRELQYEQETRTVGESADLYCLSCYNTWLRHANNLKRPSRPPSPVSAHNTRDQTDAIENASPPVLHSSPKRRRRSSDATHEPLSELVLTTQGHHTSESAVVFDANEFDFASHGCDDELSNIDENHASTEVGLNCNESDDRWRASPISSSTSFSAVISCDSALTTPCASSAPSRVPTPSSAVFDLDATPNQLEFEAYHHVPPCESRQTQSLVDVVVNSSHVRSDDGMRMSLYHNDDTMRVVKAKLDGVLQEMQAFRAQWSEQKQSAPMPKQTKNRQKRQPPLVDASHTFRDENEENNLPSISELLAREVELQWIRPKQQPTQQRRAVDHERGEGESDLTSTTQRFLLPHMFDFKKGVEVFLICRSTDHKEGDCVATAVNCIEDCFVYLLKAMKTSLYAAGVRIKRVIEIRQVGQYSNSRFQKVLTNVFDTIKANVVRRGHPRGIIMSWLADRLVKETEEKEAGPCGRLAVMGARQFNAHQTKHNIYFISTRLGEHNTDYTLTPKDIKQGEGNVAYDKFWSSVGASTLNKGVNSDKNSYAKHTGEVVVPLAAIQ